MTFSENLKKLPPIEDVDRLDLIDEAGEIVATIENKAGQSGSLAVYCHLVQVYATINASSAMEGLRLFAEHTNSAEQMPGKHPNIDRLFAVIAGNLTLRAKIIRK